MAINFGKLNIANTVDTITHPRELFAALPGKAEGKLQYPRDVQAQVWEQWFQRKDERDLVIKMNTGSGKTIVGLLILKSSLNEKKSPAVYIVPDNYLVEQVKSEAEDLGIETTSEPDSPRFLSGKAILITNIHRLINGKSIFGVGDAGIKINIGTLLIDDAHACLETIEEQFTIKITAGECYDDLFRLLKESLQSQCESKAIEIENNEASAYMQVPFWSWKNNCSEILKVLLNHSGSEELRFVLPLLKNLLHLCRCVVSATKIEITPFCIPIHMIPSIIKCERKIFMTATLANNNILSSHFGISEDSINRPLSPAAAGDIGDRMILLPQVLNTELSDKEIKRLCKFISNRINVVVIVPSKVRAGFWADDADMILDKNNIHEGVEKLKKGHVGLVVLVNRYDGIDLPGDACRLLIIDGLPDVRRLIDKVTQSILMGSDRTIDQVVQRVEQGMGRGIRSSDDYCSVFLIGKHLTRQLYANNALERFSPATKAQLGLAEQLSDVLQNATLKTIWEDAVLPCITRDSGWVTASKGVLASLVYDDTAEADAITVAQRKAFDCALYNDYSAASAVLNNVLSTINNELSESYLKLCLAEYINLYDEPEAQKILMSAVRMNTNILKPIAGIAYHKLEFTSSMDQARNCSKFLRQEYTDPNKIIIEVNGILENLIFKEGTANMFEAEFKRIANFIGFGSQRPEHEYGKGPDVLWELGGLNYLVVECKNGVTSKTGLINKHDCNQLNGSAMWFESKYDNTCAYTPILIHPSTKFEHAGTAHENTRIINNEGLTLLKRNIQEFIKSICVQNKTSDIEAIRKSLIHHKLRQEDFIATYTLKFS